MNARYARKIDTVRKTVAFVFVGCCFGIVVAARFRIESLLLVLGAVALGCLFAAFGLCIEYLVRCWREGRSRLAGNQFSLRGVLLLTTLVAVVVASFRVLGDAAIGLLAVAFVVGAILLACALETIHRGRAKRETDKPERIFFY